MSEHGELAQRIRDGATDEFGELVRRHQSRVFAVLHHYERDTHRVEDLAQETFLKAWRALPHYQAIAPFEHWISRIAVRTALDHLRRQNRLRLEISLGDLGDEALEWLRSGDDGAGLNSRDAVEILAHAMRELTPSDRVVLTMQELEGRSVKEIAAALGASGIAVRVRALRARARLKRALEKILKS